ncbi:MAG: Ni/Fe hydrogenase subunit alpha [Gammaproteobacteria bacterium]
MTERRTVDIHVPVLARVEGEGALELAVRDGAIEKLMLRIYEPPRLFEQFLVGREYHEVPDMVARICGICPVAYQMSAAHAIEQAFGMDIDPWVRDMRRLYYCGEWLESHALHIHMLAVPDFLGYPSVTAMAQDYPAEVRRGLRLQGLGNAIVAALGARSVHPVGARVGGFSRAPTAAEARSLLERVREALPDAEELVRWTASLELPASDQDFTTVALRHRDEYPMNEGRIVSSAGLDIDIREFDDHFREHQVPHSTALHSHLHDRPYLVGPLARLNLNLDRLPPQVQDLLEDTGLSWPSRNMFHSVVARAAEIHYGCIEAIRLLECYQVPTAPRLEATPRAGVGYGCTEAPRGILWHRYEFDERGTVLDSRIIPPTSQNQARIEQDLKWTLEAGNLDDDDRELRRLCETVIRNYDPCISCATHFLDLRISRR